MLEAIVNSDFTMARKFGGSGTIDAAQARSRGKAEANSVHTTTTHFSVWWISLGVYKTVECVEYIRDRGLGRTALTLAEEQNFNRPVLLERGLLCSELVVDPLASHASLCLEPETNLPLLCGLVWWGCQEAGEGVLVDGASDTHGSRDKLRDWTAGSEDGRREPEIGWVWAGL